ACRCDFDAAMDVIEGVVLDQGVAHVALKNDAGRENLVDGVAANDIARSFLPAWVRAGPARVGNDQNTEVGAGNRVVLDQGVNRAPERNARAAPVVVVQTGAFHGVTGNRRAGAAGNGNRVRGVAAVLYGNVVANMNRAGSTALHDAA